MKIGVFAGTGQFGPKFQVHFRPPPIIFWFGRKTRLMCLLYDIRSFFLSQLKRLTDGQTEDGQMDGNLVTNTALHSMQRGKNGNMMG